VAPRFQPAFGTVCRFRVGEENGPLRVGLVWNISSTGISMLLADPPERGSDLEAELTNDAGSARLSIRIKVVHIRSMPHGDYFLGAQFEHALTDDELEQFLLPPAPEPRKAT
jgi:hypothetical protein